MNRLTAQKGVGMADNPSEKEALLMVAKRLKEALEKSDKLLCGVPLSNDFDGSIIAQIADNWNTLIDAKEIGLK